MEVEYDSFEPIEVQTVPIHEFLDHALESWVNTVPAEKLSVDSLSLEFIVRDGDIYNAVFQAFVPDSALTPERTTTSIIEEKRDEIASQSYREPKLIALSINVRHDDFQETRNVRIYSPSLSNLG